MSNPKDKASEIISALYAQDFSLEQLQKITEALKSARSRCSSKIKDSFNVGDRVAFESKGSMIVGKIFKINRKNLSIETDSGSRWRVSPSLVSPITTLHRIV